QGLIGQVRQRVALHGEPRRGRVSRGLVGASAPFVSRAFLTLLDAPTTLRATRGARKADRHASVRWRALRERSKAAARAIFDTPARDLEWRSSQIEPQRFVRLRHGALVPVVPALVESAVRRHPARARFAPLVCPRTPDPRGAT